MSLLQHVNFVSGVDSECSFVQFDYFVLLN